MVRWLPGVPRPAVAAGVAADPRLGWPPRRAAARDLARRRRDPPTRAPDPGPRSTPRPLCRYAQAMGDEARRTLAVVAGAVPVTCAAGRRVANLDAGGRRRDSSFLSGPGRDDRRPARLLSA